MYTLIFDDSVNWSNLLVCITSEQYISEGHRESNGVNQVAGGIMGFGTKGESLLSSNPSNITIQWQIILHRYHYNNSYRCRYKLNKILKDF